MNVAEISPFSLIDILSSLNCTFRDGMKLVCDKSALFLFHNDACHLCDDVWNAVSVKICSCSSSCPIDDASYRDSLIDGHLLKISILDTFLDPLSDSILYFFFRSCFCFSFLSDDCDNTNPFDLYFYSEDGNYDSLCLSDPQVASVALASYSQKKIVTECEVDLDSLKVTLKAIYPMIIFATLKLSMGEIGDEYRMD